MRLSPLCVLSEDLGDDPIRSANLGIENLKRVMPNVVNWTRNGDPDQTYDKAADLYSAVIYQWSLYLYHVLANVGGIYMDRPVLSETFSSSNLPAAYTHVEKARQKASVQFLLDNVLSYQEWLFGSPISKVVYPLRNTPNGTTMIHNFLYRVCGAHGDWTMADFKRRSVDELRRHVGDGRVLLALSGGVDSSVLAALLSEAIGSQLTCVFVDHGLLRKNEGDEVEAVFAPRPLNFRRVDAADRFLARLRGVTEPEEKRHIIGEEFIRVFEAEAGEIGAVDYLAQGTIYPDVIESGLGQSAVIKSHHNVGGLPDYVDFKEILEPLRLLFKDEVRQLGRELGFPESLVSRQPFPGPGLAIRVIGEVTADKLALLREADAIFREEMARAGLDQTASQYFAVLTNLRSVGVMGDGRSYDYAVALRSVQTSDFMTADFTRLPWDLLDRVSVRIVNEVKGVNRVLYDITSKPQATVEYE